MPFPADTALCKELLWNNPTMDFLPGEPCVCLDEHEVRSFLTNDLRTPVLDELYDHLWMVARKLGHSIAPLHRHKQKGRQIVATEDAGLHLVWHPDKIYVKRIPRCLLNHDVWDMYLAPQPVPSGTESNGTHDQAKGGHLATSPRAAALGLLRSYAYLIKGELDFIYAVEAHLIPEGVDWVQWKRFIHHFISVEDQSVAKRYHYGQLRLSRLDWAVRLFRPRSRKGRTRWIHYEPSHQGSLTRLFERATVPLAFLIAGVSVLLSAMQVALGTGSIGEQLPGVNFDAMRASFWLVSMFIMGGCAVATLLFIILPTSVVTWQLVWGYKQKGDAEEMCSIRREEYLA